MFSYNLKLALRSMRRTPVMTILMVLAIAIGIGVSMTTLTVHYMMSGNPIPQKSDVLFAITLDSWNPLRPFDDDRPDSTTRAGGTPGHKASDVHEIFFP